MKTYLSRIAIAAAVLLTAGAAAAEYLYAWIGNSNNGVVDIYHGQVINFDYATFSIPGTSGYLPITGGTIAGTGVASAGSSASAQTETAFYVGDDNTTFNTFLVELWLGDVDPTRVGWQQYSRAQFADSIYTGTGGSGDTAFSITSVIPEPTSGILLLLGMAGLALRRRRA